MVSAPTASSIVNARSKFAGIEIAREWVLPGTLQEPLYTFGLHVAARSTVFFQSSGFILFACVRRGIGKKLFTKTFPSSWADA